MFQDRCVPAALPPANREIIQELMSIEPKLDQPLTLLLRRSLQHLRNYFVTLPSWQLESMLLTFAKIIGLRPLPPAPSLMHRCSGKQIEDSGTLSTSCHNKWMENGGVRFHQ